MNLFELHAVISTFNAKISLKSGNLFFYFRIHLERESVRRAKNSLKAQKKSFENRQRELKQKLVDGEPGSKAIIDQIYQVRFSFLRVLSCSSIRIHRILL